MKLEVRHHEDIKDEKCRVNIGEELQVLMVKKMKSGEQKQASTKQAKFPRIPVVKKNGQKSKKDTETKKENETAAVKSLDVRKEYNEQQRTKIKRRSGKSSKTTAKTEDIQDQKSSPEVSIDTKIKKKAKKQSLDYNTEGRMVAHSDARKWLPVRARHVSSEKIFSYEYEDDFESDNEIKSSMSGANQAGINNITILSYSNTTTPKRGQVVGKKKYHVEKSLPPGSKELVLSTESSFALPKVVDVKSIEPLCKQLRGAIDTTPHAPRNKELCLPSIELNNFVIAKNPLRTSSKDKNYTTEVQDMLAKEKSLEAFNRRSEHQEQSAQRGMGHFRCMSSVRRKSSARYDCDFLENRARAPPFDKLKEEEVKMKFPKI